MYGQKFDSSPFTTLYLKVSPEGEGFVPSHRETVRAKWLRPRKAWLAIAAEAARPVPLDRPQVDRHLTELSAIERAAEVLRFSAYRLEYALSPGGHLRAWFKLNLLLALLLAIPTVLVMPVVTLFLGTVATWSQYLLTAAVNILLALIAGTASVALATLLFFLIRVLRRL